MQRLSKSHLRSARSGQLITRCHHLPDVPRVPYSVQSEDVPDARVDGHDSLGRHGRLPPPLALHTGDQRRSDRLAPLLHLHHSEGGVGQTQAGGHTAPAQTLGPGHQTADHLTDGHKLIRCDQGQAGGS